MRKRRRIAVVIGMLLSGVASAQTKNSYVTFDGVDDFLITPEDGVSVEWSFPNGFTLSTDVLTTASLSGWRTLISVQEGDRQGAPVQRAYLHIYNEQIAGGFIAADGTVAFLQGGSVPSDGQWRNFAVAFDGVGLSAYIDGELITAQNMSTARTLGSFFGFITMGGNFQFSNEWFAGGLDNIRVWSVGLDGEQIARQAVTRVNMWGDDDSLAKHFILTGESPTPTPSPSPTSTPTPTPSPTPSPTPTPTPSPTATPTPSPTPPSPEFWATLVVKVADEATTRTWSWHSHRDAAIELQDVGLWLWLLDAMGQGRNGGF